MATAPLTTSEIQLIPLVDADFAQLDLLFDEQCQEWFDLLGWNYTNASQLIRQVVRDRDLSGYVAMSGNAAIGFIYYVIESNRCSIGEIFITREWRGLGVDKRLAEAVLTYLEKFPRIRRIESQSLSIENQASHDFLTGYGFTRLDRNYMSIALDNYQPLKMFRADSNPSVVHPAPDIFIRAWRDEDFNASVKVIQSSYKDTVDSRINNQYCTEEGCADLLAVLTQHVWCGDFLPHIARVAIDQKSNKILGLLTASRIADGRGHISQISVRPEYQGLRIGRRMIESALKEFAVLNFKTVSLAVTAVNKNALHLYESCGFQTVHSFPVFYLDR
ncbi:MAG: GNAT family N-acetyltransferase [Acidobacteriota bacterium]